MWSQHSSEMNAIQVPTRPRALVATSSERFEQSKRNHVATLNGALSDGRKVQARQSLYDACSFSVAGL